MIYSFNNLWYTLDKKTSKSTSVGEDDYVRDGTVVVDWDVYEKQTAL